MNLFEVRKQDGAWLNPSARDLATLVAQKDMRGVAVGNDIWLDYAYEDTHYGLRNRLGLPGDSCDSTGDPADGFNFYAISSSPIPGYDGEYNPVDGGREDWIDVGSDQANYELPGVKIYTNVEEGEMVGNRAFLKLVSRTISEDVKWSNRTHQGDEIVWVDAEKVRASWARDRYSYFDSEDHPNAVKGRIPRFNDWIKKGEAVNLPEVTLRDDGEISFTNGRHRFVWMLQNGETRIPVAVPEDYADEVRRKFGSDPIDIV